MITLISRILSNNLKARKFFGNLFLVAGFMLPSAVFGLAKLTIEVGYGNAVTVTGVSSFEETVSGSREMSVSDNTIIQIKANPSAAYHFTGWKLELPNGGVVSGANASINGSTEVNISLRMDTNYRLTAIFAPNTYSVSLAANPAGLGTVRMVNPVGLDLNAVPHGQFIRVEATPNSSNAFVSWVGTGSITYIKPYMATTDVEIMSNTVLTANFSQSKNKLNVLITPAGSGSVNSLGSFYTKGQEIAIQAEAYMGHQFVEWRVRKGNIIFPAGGETSTSTEITLGDPSSGENGEWTLEAVFIDVASNSARVDVRVDAGGAVLFKEEGATAVDLVGPTTRSFTVRVNKSVTLTARGMGGGFAGWDAPAGTTFTAHQDQVASYALKGHDRVLSFHAKFTPPRSTIMLAVKHDGESNAKEPGTSPCVLEGQSGSVNLSTTSVGTSKAQIEAGAYLDLIAKPASGFAFQRWEVSNATVNYGGGITTSPAYAYAELSNASNAMCIITAIFVPLKQKYTVHLETSEGGTAAATGSFTDPLIGVAQTISFTASSGNPDQRIYQDATVVTFTAAADSNFEFANWTGGVSPATNASGTITVDGNKNIRANFTRVRSSLTLEVVPSAAAGSIVIDGDGSAPLSTYAVNTNLSLRAVPAAGWQFDRWEDAITGTNNVGTVNLSTDKNVRAVFTRIFRLTVNVSPDGCGTVSGGGDYVVDASAPVSVTAVNAGCIFLNWTGNTTGISPGVTSKNVTVPMDADKTITANFVRGKQVQVTAVSSPDSVGNFVPTGDVAAAIKAVGDFYGSNSTSLASICHAAGGTDTAHVVKDTVVTLSAIPVADGGTWRFVRWETAANPGVDIGTSHMVVADVELRAVYTNQRIVTTAVKLDGSETASIGVTVGGVTKHNGDTTKITHNTATALNAPTYPSYIFSSWNNVDGGTVATAAATVTPTADTTITANYKTKRTLTVSLGTNPTGGEGSLSLASLVTVQNVTAGTTLTILGNPSTLEVGQGDNITLTATPTVTAAGVKYRFEGWDLGNDGSIDSTSETYTTAISTNASVKAVYKKRVSLTVEVAPAAAGTTSPAVGTHEYDYGATVPILVATTATGKVFNNWSSSTGAVFASATTTSSNEIVMNADHVITANFNPSQNALAVQIKVDDVVPNPVPSVLKVAVSGGTSGSTVNLGHGEHEPFYYGNIAQIAAATPAGYKFDRWESTPNTVTVGTPASTGQIDVTGAQTVTACYKSLHTLTLISETLPSGTGGAPTISGYESTGAGGTYVYLHNNNASLQANPTTPAFRFLRWEIDINGDGVADSTQTTASCSISVGGDMTVKAIYAAQYKLTIATDNAGAGQTSPAIGNESTRYYGENVPLSVSSLTTGWHFVDWTANAGSTLTNADAMTGTQLTIKGETIATAHFARDGIVLTARILVDGVAPVTANPALVIIADGTTLVDSGTKGYLYGLNANLTPATGLADYEFDSWGNALSGSAVPGTLTMNGAKTVSANYASLHALALSIETRSSNAGDVGGTVSANDAVRNSGATYTYKHGRTATLVAAPASGFRFLGWSIDGNSTLAPGNQIVMNDNHTAKAVFAKLYTLTMAITDSAAGTLTPSVGTSQRYHGEVVTLSVASKNTGWYFNSWTAAGSTAITNATAELNATITMASDETITANFSRDNVVLTARILVDGVAPGSPVSGLVIYANGTSLADGETKGYLYGDAASVAPATGLSGYEFDGWGLALTGNANPGSVTMNGSKTLSANYASLHTLTLSVEVRPTSGDTGGTVSASGAARTSGSTYAFKHGTVATLTANADSGYQFIGWIVDGSASLTSSNSIQMNGDHTAKAVFAKQYTLTMAMTPSGAGTVTPAAGNTSPRYYGEVVNLTASAAEGYEFKNWTSSDGVSTFASATAADTNVTIRGTTTVTGNFGAQVSGLTLNVEVNGTLKPETFTDLWIKVNDAKYYSTTTKDAHYNDTFTVEAPAVAGYKFLGWADALTGTTNPNTITMTSLSMSLTARYASVHTVTLLEETRPSGDGGDTAASGYENCTGNVYEYVHGRNATLTAAPKAGYSFVGWDSGNDGSIDSGSLTYVFPVTANVTVKAVYALQYTITFSTIPTDGRGGSINKPATYTAYHGQVISNIQAIPNSNPELHWSLYRWHATGLAFDNTADNPVSFTVTGSKTITAEFRQGAAALMDLFVDIRLDGALNPDSCPSALNVTADGSTAVGEGSPSVLHAGESKKYFKGDTATLVASQPAGYEFLGWDDNFTEASHSLENMLGTRRITAIYKTTASLTMAIVPAHIGATTPPVGTHTSLPAPVGKLYKGMTIDINSVPSDEHVDHYAFTGWTVNDGELPVRPGIELTSVNMDVVSKALTANYVPGYRLEVRIKLETTANTADAKTYQEVKGDRSNPAAAAGNRAGIYLSEPNSIPYALRTMRIGGTVQIRAMSSGVPGYKFVGWTTDPDGTTPEFTDEILTLTMDAPKLYFAIFEKMRLNFTVHTVPGGNPDVRGEALNCKLISGVGTEPRVYEIFYGTSPTLKATSDDSRYNFLAWFNGIGYSLDMTDVLSNSPQFNYPLNVIDSNRHVTAYFVGSGFVRLVLFTAPKEEIDISNVWVRPAMPVAPYGPTYTMVNGRPAYVCDVALDYPFSAIPLHANPSVVGKTDSEDYYFDSWRPAEEKYRMAAAWISNRGNPDATLKWPVLEGAEAVNEIHLEAVYGHGTGYRLALELDIDLHGATIDPRFMGEGLVSFQDLLGDVTGSTVDYYTNYPVLYANRVIEATAAIFEGSHVETFTANNVFKAGPFMLNRWEYQRPEGTASPTIKPVLSAGDDTFTTLPGVVGQNERVIAKADVILYNIDLTKPLLLQPETWAPKDIDPTGMLAFHDYGTFSKVPADIILPLKVSPPLPANLLERYKRAKTASAPALYPANSTPAGFRMLGWDVTGDEKVDIAPRTFVDGHAWPEAVWPFIVTGTRTITPVYIRQMNMTLEMEDTTGTVDTGDVAEFFAPDPWGGLKVDYHHQTVSKTYDYGMKFDVVATPQQYHVVTKWVVEQATADGGATFDKTTVYPEEETDTVPQTVSVDFNYPTKVKVYFGWQKFLITLKVAEDSKGDKHGKVMLAMLPAEGSKDDVSRMFEYSATPKITAIPDEGYYFTGWTWEPTELAGPVNPALADTSIQVDGEKTLTAHFARKVTLTMTSNPGTLPNNITVPAKGVHSTYEGNQLVDGSVVRIQAVQNDDYEFTSWTITDDSGPRTETDSTLNITLFGNTTASANYARLYAVKLEATPSSAEESKVASTPAPGAGGPMVAVSNSGGVATGSYRENTEITVTATAGTHFTFDHWEISINDVLQPGPYKTDATITHTVTAPTTFKAVFTPKSYPVVVEAYSNNSRTPVALTLTGSTSASVVPPSHNFLLDGNTWMLPYGSTVTLSTSPADYYAFERWTNAAKVQTLSTEASGYSIVVSGNTTIYAEFVRDEYLLTTATDPVGVGAITSDPVRLTNPSVHAVNATVSLTAGNTAGKDFSQWEGDIGTAVATNANIVVTMNQDRSVTAKYVDVVRVKVINQNPTFGSVNVTGHRRTETSGADTVYVFEVGATASINGTPVSGHYQFGTWTFSPSTPAGVSDVTASSQSFVLAATPEELTVTASFSAKPYDLTVRAVSSDPAPYVGAPIATALQGTGAFTGSPHDFLTTATKSVSYNTAVTLSTAAAPYYKFDCWTNAAEINHGTSASSCVRTVVGDEEVLAKFTRSHYKLTAHIAPAGSGSITFSPLGSADPRSTADTTVYEPGTTVTMTAGDVSGYIFTGWTGADASGATGRALQLIMNQDREVTANYTTAYTITIPKPTNGSAAVTGYSEYVEPKTNPDGSTTYTFPAGATATITATPESGHYEFVTWTSTPTTPTGLDVTSATDSFPVDGNYVITPTFAPKKYDVVVKPYSADPAPYVGAPIANSLKGTGSFEGGSGSGHDFLAVDTKSIPYNVQVSLTQAAAPYYTFSRWTDGAHAATVTPAFTVDGAREIFAEYTRSGYKLTAHISPASGGNLLISPAGSNDPLATPDTTVYAPRTTVSLVAQDVSGKVFTGWTGPDSAGASGRNLQLEMTQDREVTANFANAFSITIPKTTNGTVTVGGYSPYVTPVTNPDGSVTYIFVEGATVTLTATPKDEHYGFTTWTATPSTPPGMDITNPNTSFTADRSYTIQPVFDPVVYDITVRAYSASPAPYVGAPVASTLIASGAFPGSPHNFLAVETKGIAYGTSVTLSQAAAPYYTFSRWTDGAHVITDVPTFQVSGTRTIVAEYVRNLYKLTTHVAPAGSGSVANTPLGATDPMGTVDTVVYNAGATVKLKASPASGNIFAGWTGASAPAGGGSSTLNLTMNADHEVTANFAEAVVLKVREPVNGTIVVTGHSSEIPVTTQYGVKSYTFAKGTVATITIDNIGTHFELDRWGYLPSTPGGVDVTQQTQIFTMDQDYIVEAEIVSRVYTLTVVPSPVEAAVSLVADANTLNAFSFLPPEKTLSRTYATISSGLVATNKARLTTSAKDQAGAHYRFSNWTEGDIVLSNNAEYLHAFDHDALVVAHYIQQAKITMSPARDVTQSPYGNPSGLGGGTVSLSTGVHLIDVKPVPEVLTIRATPDEGYVFARWIGDIGDAESYDSSTGELRFVVDSAFAAKDRVLTPCFERKRFRLTYGTWDKTLEVANLGGSIAVTPASPYADGTYYYGTQVKLVLTTSSNHVMTGWDENGDKIPDGNKATELTLIMTQDRIRYAIFERLYTLKLSADPADGSLGTVQPLSPAGIAVAGGWKFPANTVVTIAATGRNSGSFKEWLGAVANPSMATTTVQMTDNIEVVGRFESKAPRVLSITVEPSAAAGTVSVNSVIEAGGVKPANYTAVVAQGDRIILHAQPASGYVFDTWEGPIPEESRRFKDVSVTIDENLTLVAHFKPATYLLTVKASPSNAGTVTGGGHFTAGEFATASLVSTETGYVFNGWDINNDGVPDTTSAETSVTVEMTSNKTINAIFAVQAARGQLTVLYDPEITPGSYTLTLSSDPLSASYFIYDLTITVGGSYEILNVTGESLTNIDTTTPRNIFKAQVVLDVNQTVIVHALPPMGRLKWSAVSDETGGRGTITGYYDETGEEFTSGTQVPLGTKVTLVPEAEEGSVFVGWSWGNGSITIDGDLSVVGTFRKIIRNYNLRVGISASSVSHPADVVNFENSNGDVVTSATFPEGSEVTISCRIAHPDEYGLEGWEGAPPTSSEDTMNKTLTVRMTSHLNIKAIINAQVPLCMAIALKSGVPENSADYSEDMQYDTKQNDEGETVPKWENQDCLLDPVIAAVRYQPGDEAVTHTIYATPAEGKHVDSWGYEIIAGRAGATVEFVGEQFLVTDPTLGYPAGTVGRTVRFNARYVLVKVYYNDNWTDSGHKYNIHGNKERLDDPDTKSPGHFINTGTNTYVAPITP